MALLTDMEARHSPFLFPDGIPFFGQLILSILLFQAFGDRLVTHQSDRP